MACVFAAIVTGCSSGKIPGPAYPSRIERGQTLNIQVFRRGARIELVNATTHAFPESRLWLNGRYSAQIPGIAIGENVRIPLAMFKDEFGDGIRAGGFFASERPEPVVLAEIQVLKSGPGSLQGLIVVESGGDS